MKKSLLAVILLTGVSARADLTFAPRYDYIGGRSELANRLVLDAKMNASQGPFGIYVEGFGDFDQAASATEVRRSPYRGYLQEAYFEFKLDSIYVRIGRQALRWSESWSLPSLDIWTGRRFNRLFFDPFSEQLTHSTGASFSYASEIFGLDLVAIKDVAETIYPEPFPRTLVTNENHDNSFGARVKLNLGGFGFSAVAARVLKKDTYGFTANYAFDSLVPKFEVGTSRNNSTQSLEQNEEYFSTIGCDIFWGDFVLLPQVTLFDFGDLNRRHNDFESAYYLSLQWNPDKHDVQAQIYFNSTTQDSFASLSYGYNVNNNFTARVFAQNYEGSDGGLYNTFKDITGGWAAGVRMELTGNLPF